MHLSFVNVKATVRAVETYREEHFQGVVVDWLFHDPPRSVFKMLVGCFFNGPLRKQFEKSIALLQGPLTDSYVRMK